MIIIASDSGRKSLDPQSLRRQTQYHHHHHHGVDTRAFFVHINFDLVALPWLYFAADVHLAKFNLI